MIRLKDTDLPLPTNVAEISYKAFEMYRESNFLGFFKEVTGANPDLYPDLIQPYAASCSEVIMACVEMSQAIRKTITHNGKTYTLPDDLGECTARQFWAHELATDDLSRMCAYLPENSYQELSTAPYYIVRGALLFFFKLQNHLPILYRICQKYHQAKKQNKQDLSSLHVGKDGVAYSHRWQEINSLSTLN
jgi:hypothetical protein